jgi:hypothetical protein
LDNEFPEGSRISSERFEDQLYEILKSPNSIIIGVGIDVDDKDENGAIKVNPISVEFIVAAGAVPAGIRLAPKLVPIITIAAATEAIPNITKGSLKETSSGEVPM